MTDGADDTTWDSMLQLFRLVANEQISARKALELAKDFYYERISADDIPAVIHSEPMTGSQPAPPSEMPEAVHEAANYLQQEAGYEFAQPPRTDGEKMMRRNVLYAAADALESWWRTQPAPAAVAMTPELERVLQRAEEDARTCYATYEAGRRSDIAAVRAQASQPQGVKLPKVREALITLSGCIYMQENMDKVIAALAELDAAEGRKP